MTKNKSTPRVSTHESEKLTHSPFTALAARGAAPTAGAEQPSAPQPSAAEPATAVASKSRGRLVLRRETKHRGGKAVVIVSGCAALPGFDARAIDALAKECKQALGCGGTVDGDEIVLQGDRAGEVAELLRGKGFRVAGVTS